MDVKINFNRLKEDIEELSQIGEDPNGGNSRPSYSKADLEAREWLKNRYSLIPMQEFKAQLPLSFVSEFILSLLKKTHIYPSEKQNHWAVPTTFYASVYLIGEK